MSNKKIVRLLLVDDDPDVLLLLEAVIEQKFYHAVQIQSTDDSAEALRILDKDLVDILITDLEMPGIDGLELIRCAKQKNAWTQILLFTGKSTLNSLLSAMETGATDYLLKSSRIADLEEVIGSMITRINRWEKALASTFTTV